MGDRAYCQIRISEAHREALEPTLEEYGFSEDGSGAFLNDGVMVVQFEDCEANYGGQEALEALQERALPFVGGHETGGNYSAMVFAFDGEFLAECVSVEGSPTCRVKDDGEPEANSLEYAREYLRVAAAAKKAMIAANEEASAKLKELPAKLSWTEVPGGVS